MVESYVYIALSFEILWHRVRANLRDCQPLNDKINSAILASHVKSVECHGAVVKALIRLLDVKLILDTLST